MEGISVRIETSKPAWIRKAMHEVDINGACRGSCSDWRSIHESVPTGAWMTSTTSGSVETCAKTTPVLPPASDPLSAQERTGMSSFGQEGIFCPPRALRTALVLGTSGLSRSLNLARQAILPTVVLRISITVGAVYDSTIDTTAGY